MEAPKNYRDIEEAKRNRKAEQARNTVGLVWPDGRVTTHVCAPPEEGDDGIRTGDTPVRWANGEPAVWKPYRDRGCKLLREVCEADGVPERYVAWQQVIAAQIMSPGMPIRGNVEDLYPPTVIARRSSYEVGGNADGLAFVIGQGVQPDPESATNKLVKQLVSAGLPQPTEDEINAAKPAKGKT